MTFVNLTQNVPHILYTMYTKIITLNPAKQIKTINKNYNPCKHINYYTSTTYTKDTTKKTPNSKAKIFPRDPQQTPFNSTINSP